MDALSVNEGAQAAARGRADRRGALARLVGFGCLQGWVNVTFMSNLIHYSLRGSISHLNYVYMYWCFGIVMASVLALLPWRRLVQGLRGRCWRAAGETTGGAAGPAGAAGGVAPRVVRLGLAIALILLVVGTCVLISAERNPPGRPWCVIFSFVLGVATSAVYWCWGSVYVSTLDRHVAAHFGAAFALGAALYALVLFLPEMPALGCTLALPVVSVVCLLRCPVGASASDTLRVAPQHCRVVFARALAATAMLAFAVNFMRALFQSSHPFADMHAYSLVFFASACAAVAVGVVTAHARRGRDSIGRVNHVLMVVLALLFLIAPAVWDIGLAGDAVTTACFFLLHLLVWTTLSQIASIYRLNVFAPFAMGLGVAHAFSVVGTVLGSALFPAISAVWRLQVVCSVACACLVLASFLFIADERTFVEMLDVENEHPSTPRRFALRCERAAQVYGLSPKEAEIMQFIAKGRSAQRIQEQLGIALSTVNTHISHIYRKMDVHGRQELLDLLDREG